MNVKKWIIGATVAASLGAAQSWAVGGITLEVQDPHYATGANQSDFEDMRVKVLGGEVRMTRRWTKDGWAWNSRWDDIKVPDLTSLGENDEVPPHITRSGQPYVLNTSASADGELIYENVLVRTLTWNPNTQLWLWADRQGNRIEYNAHGQMTRYWDRNGVTVSVTRNAADNITEIRDHHGNVAIALTWEAIPEADPVENKQGEEIVPQRLVELRDYTDRIVTYFWDAENNLTAITDVRGETWTYDYVDEHSLRQTDPEGRTTAINMDRRGRVVSILNADGVGKTYSYKHDEESGEYYLSTTDGTGAVSETNYNGHGMTLRSSVDGEEQSRSNITMSDGSSGTQALVNRYSRYRHTTTRVYRDGNLVSVSTSTTKENPLANETPIYVKYEAKTDARGNTTRYEYDMWKNVIGVTHPDGSTRTTTYNVYSQPLVVTDERGVVTEYEYDDKGNLLTRIEAKGAAVERTTRYTYDEYGQRLSMTTGESAAGNTELATTRWEYDDYGNVTKIIDPLEYETSYSDYDALGNAYTTTDARGKVWRTTFDEAGNLLTERNPYDQGETYVYNKAGDLQSQTAANGATTTFETNASGLIAKITDAAGHITTLEYDKANRLTGTIDPNGNGSYTAYDEQGRIRSTTDGAGNITRYNYAGGQLDSIQYPTFAENYQYDNRGRITGSTQYANNRTYLRRYGYDLSDHVNSTTDANGNSGGHEYDQLNRLIRSTDAEGGVTEFEYDARDNSLKVTDPEGRITAYTYTLRNERATETKHDYIGTDKQFVYTYDENGNLKTRRTPEKEYTEYNYDDANRLGETRLFVQQGDLDPIKLVTYLYNDFGQNTGYVQTVGTGPGANPTPDILPLAESYTYNTLDHLDSVTVDFGLFQKTYSYTYYPNGLKKTYTNPEGITYTYYYTKHNELAAVHIPGEGQIGFTNFNWTAPQTILLPGGSKITLTYDQFLQVEQRLLTDPADTELANALYEYDLENNITQITEGYGSLTFGYDDLYRLADADYPWEDQPILKPDESFDYDGVGNRIEHGPGSASLLTEAEREAATTTLEYDNHNRLIGSSDGVSFSYNSNGHTTQKALQGETTDYVYNRDERLIEVRIDGVTVGEYSYNPDGQRVRKTANGHVTWLLYNEEGLAAEYDQNGNLIKEYHFKPYQPWMTEPLFQRTADGSVYYYQNDNLGTPQRMVDKSGAVVWEARYEAFGKAEVLVEEVGNRLRFPGQYFDSETGLHHNYYRDYDSDIGRYIQSDPISLHGGVNSFAYAGGSPANSSDPFGLRDTRNTYTNYCVKNPASTVCSTPKPKPVPPPVPPTLDPSSEDCDDNEDDECADLIRQMSEARDTINRRIEELLTDKCEQYRYAYRKPNPNRNCGGNTTFIGHVNQIEGWQNRLKNLISQANRKGCSIPPGVWKAATRYIPRTPRGILQ